MNLSLAYRFISILLFISFLGSCKKKESQFLPSSSEEVYIQVEIPILQQTMREKSMDDPMRSIESLSMLFFDGNSSDSQLVEIREINEFINTSEGICVKLPQKEEYYLLCIANASKEVKQLIRKGCKAEVFLHKEFPILTRRMSREPSSEELKGAIMMTNAEGLVPINESNYFKNETEQKKSRPVRLILESIAARVLLNASLPQIENSSLKMQEGVHPRYLITGLSKEIYWLRKIKLSQSDKSAPQQHEEEYAYSPGYELIAKETGKEKYHELIEKYRSFYSTADNFLKYSIEADPSVEQDLKKSSLYCKETTVDPQHYLTAFIPHIIVAYPIYPSELKVNQGKGWIAFEGKYLTEEDFVNYVAGVRANTNPPLPEGMPEEFAIAVRKIKENELLTKMDQPFSLEGIDFYWKSLNFYAWPLRHFDDSKAPKNDSFGRYGLVRNNQYTIRVKKLSWLGSNMFPNLKDNFSPLSESSSINLSIEVKELSNREQEVEY